MKYYSSIDKLSSCPHSALLQETKRLGALSLLLLPQSTHLHQCLCPLVRGVTACHPGLWTWGSQQNSTDWSTWRSQCVNLLMLNGLVQFPWRNRRLSHWPRYWRLVLHLRVIVLSSEMKKGELQTSFALASSCPYHGLPDSNLIY